MNDQEAALAIMRKPFADNQISVLCKPTNKENKPGRCKDCNGWHKLPSVPLQYVGHAALTDRLLEADPLWTWEPLALAPDGSPLVDKDGGMWIKLTVAGVTRLGYGDAQGKVGGNATKERIGDALRNAAMRFGAALELWHKGDLHVEEEEEKPAANGNGAATVQKLQEISKLQEYVDEIMRCETMGVRANEAQPHGEGLRGAYERFYVLLRSRGDIPGMKTVSEAYEIRKKQLEAVQQ